MDTDVAADRRHLVRVAYRLLGTTADAEDAVGEAYARWYRLDPARRDEVRVPAAWLTTTVSRICLDVLGSARNRRESYVGEWLPEPVPTGFASGPDDPAERAELGDAVGSALMVVLETLTPAQRVALVLHDVFSLSFDEIATVLDRSPEACRQLAAAARRSARTQRPAPPARRHHEVVTAFAAACRTGSLEALLAVLDPGLVLTSDGGGIVNAARRSVLGASNGARFLLGILAKRPDVEATFEDVDGRTAVALRSDGAVFAVATFGLAGDVVSDIWIVMNPQKLRGWT